MDKKSKVLLAFMIALTVLSVSTLFYKAIVLQDFELIKTETDIKQQGDINEE